MAFATLPPPPVCEIRQAYEFTGSVARDLVARYEAAVNQLTDRPSLRTWQDVQGDEYQHVPFRRVGTVKVRFNAPRPMNPRPIEIEDDAG
jgi:hypothetical protein